MNINKFVSNFKNHPVLFVGTGLSLRYLNNSYTWDGLLSRISKDLTNNTEFYLDLKSKCSDNESYNYAKIATLLEEEFNKRLESDRNGTFQEINNIFYENMTKEINISRFKIYISKLLSTLEFKDEKLEELSELKKIRKNISSVVTTNYDNLIEEIFEFDPLIGNNILLSNPYGSIYKIHGCVSDPGKIIVTEKDYEDFDKKYELVRAQLLSLFIHNPIIFIGYKIGDENIKKILRTIFSYVEPNSEEANKIKSNFLLVQHSTEGSNEKIYEHDIDMEGFSTITINKIKTDNFIPIYSALSNLKLPVSAMDIRKVQSVIREIYSGGDIKVSITEDTNSLDNKDKILAIGSINTINYVHHNTAELIANYFNIIDESNFQLLNLIDKLTIQTNQFFPIFGFSIINNEIKVAETLKKQQLNKLKTIKSNIKKQHQTTHGTITDILENYNIADTYKIDCILWSILNENIEPELIKEYLKSRKDKKTTEYRKLLCAYDYILYKDPKMKL